MADNNAPWFKQPIFWAVMSGPILVVIAGFFTFGLAQTHANDMVSDDYYKDGKHINLELARDEAALKQHMHAKVILNNDHTAHIQLTGNFDHKVALKLLLLHPTRKDFDQTVNLQFAPSTGEENSTNYTATLSDLPNTNHWYIRIEDVLGQWRVGGKWLPSQGNTVELLPKDVSALEPERQ